MSLCFLWQIPLCFLRMLWQYREVVNFVQIHLEVPPFEGGRSKIGMKKGACRGVPNPLSQANLGRRIVPELFCIKKLKYSQNLKANKEHFKYEQGSVDFSSFCQNLRGVKVFDMGGEREIRQEMGAGMYLECGTGNGKLWGCSAQGQGGESGKRKGTEDFNGRERIQKTTEVRRSWANKVFL